MDTCNPNELDIENCTHLNLTSSMHLEKIVQQEANVSNSIDVNHQGKSRVHESDDGCGKVWRMYGGLNLLLHQFC